MTLKGTTVQLVAYLNVEWKRRLERIATAKDTSASQIVRDAIQKEVARLENELAAQGAFVAPLAERRVAMNDAQQKQIAQFLADATEQSDVGWTSKDSAYNHFQKWCALTHQFAMSKKTFGHRMGAAGFVEHRSHINRYWVGFTLRPIATAEVA